MEQYFQNSFLEINPYLRKSLLLLKEAIILLVFIFSIFLLFFQISSLRYLGLLFLLIISVNFLKRSKEDIRISFHQEKNINLDDFLEKSAKKFLIETITRAEILKIENFQTFLFQKFLEKKEIKKLFLRLNFDSQKINLKINYSQERKEYQLEILPILKTAFSLAKSLNYPSINTLFLFYGLRENLNPELEKIFEEGNLKKEYLLTGILMEVFSKKIKFKKISSFQPISLFQKKLAKRAILNKALTSQATNILDSYGLDLTYLANKEDIGFLIGHQEEIEKLIDLLKDNKNVLLIGEEGTGKETIIFNLAWRIQNDLVPKELLDYRLVKLDLSLVYSENQEKFLEILTKIIQDVLHSGYLILYFPYLENITLEEKVDVFQLLGEILRSRSIPVIATMTPLGYEKSLTKVNLDSFFEKIEVKELNENESIYLLTLKGLLIEKKEKIIITPQSISTAVSLAKKFIKTKKLPNSAEEVINEAINLAKKLNQKYITQEIIQEIVFEKTKIPVKELTEIEREKLLNLENLLHQRIINQEQAIKEIARVLRIYHSGLGKKSGPIGAFLFVGPTGVGKTETAKALAKIYYGTSDFLRLDMVEFQNPEDIDKLIGTKDGQILGRLTEPVRQNPYILTLLDEFEKTHQTILKIFLPIFDEGLIKDALGREVDFSHSLIICTSNAYSEFIKESIEKGEDFDKIKDELKSKLSQIFSVELLNRFDSIVVYKPLTEIELLKIAELMIKDLEAEILLKHGIDLDVSEGALKEIVRLGTDPIFGARPLKRKIDEIIKNEIANLLLASKVKRGQKILVDFEQNFNFQIE